MRRCTRIDDQFCTYGASGRCRECLLHIFAIVGIEMDSSFFRSGLVLLAPFRLSAMPGAMPVLVTIVTLHTIQTLQSPGLQFHFRSRYW